MILAEPEKQGYGGNGKIVTSCQLSCLSVERDKPTVIHTSSARRLILLCTSFSKKPPGVFKMESNAPPKTLTRIKSNTNILNLHRDQKSLIHDDNSNILWRSRMDLWFEDEDSVDSAYEALILKIFKARCKRGRLFRDTFSL